jgi:4-amino-4-deoxy-L-arabinose transferase-like glycosyltransferase
MNASHRQRGERALRDRLAAALSALTFALHMAVAGRYDLFRDELYFIVCGRHPAFGYADQPPLVPLVAAGMYALGGQTWLVRLPSALAAAAVVWLTVALVRLLGGRTSAALFAGVAAGFAPILLGLTATLNTTSFEPLAWTAVAYALARAAVLDDRRALIAAGIVAGLALEAKYALPLWLVALGIGLLATPQRVILARRGLWIGVLIAAAITAPSLVWQELNGWPFATLIRHASDKNIAVLPLAYALNQIFVTNPFAAPLWIAGLIAPFAMRNLRAVRFIAIAYAVTAAATIAGGGKDYYLAPAYPALLAIGATALERVVRIPALRIVYLAALIVVAAIAAPLALPILDPPALIAYQRALHLAPQSQERLDAGAVLPSMFGDMLGWHDFVRQVATAYAALTPGERVGTSIMAGNYGEAAALDIYGPAYGLPAALSGHNQYGLWALRGQPATNVLRIMRDPSHLHNMCLRVRIMGTTHSPYARTFENGRAIAYCQGLHPPLAQQWPDETFLE